MICVQNVGKRYKSKTIFEDVTLELSEGKIIAILGDNASGKSVFLRLISGLSKPDRGTISIDDKVLHKDMDFIPNCGLFINSPEFMSSWTGMANLQYLAEIRKVAKEEDIYMWTEKLRLSKEDLHKKYRTYSEGMRQKLRIIQALMDKPKYLILDEPFNSLDKTSVGILVELLSEYKKENPASTIIFTSHISSSLDIADEKYEVSDFSVVPLEN